MIIAISYKDRLTDQFELVFLVLGNHEFYNGSFATGLEKARQFEQEPSLNGRLIILHQKRYGIPEFSVTILGCRLWPNMSNESRNIVQSKIKDFQNIDDWSVDDRSATNDSDIAWLLREIRSIARQEDTRTSSLQHAQNPWKFAFGTDILPNILSDSVVKPLVFG